jgi:hypothetical protein
MLTDFFVIFSSATGKRITLLRYRGVEEINLEFVTGGGRAFK